ncbi:MAG: DUF2306 domain-containing protein [Myxococcales bacterium]
MRTLERKHLAVPVLLLALGAIPMLGGWLRLTSLSEEATAENSRFLAAPAPIVIHIFSAALYSLIGAFQFSSGFRLRWPAWHRRAGKVLAACGLLTGLTGIWMTAFYPIPIGLQGPLTHAVRMVVGFAMVTGIVVAWVSILRRDVVRHEAWMIRAYALGQGAGTQALILGPWTVLTGESEGLTRDLLLTLAWVINVGVAEWIIVRRTGRSQGRASDVNLVHSRA